jgi:thiamine monophosphate synthase
MGQQLHHGGSRWWHLRDAAVSGNEWGQVVDEARQRSAGWRAVFNGGGEWAFQIGIGAHFKASSQQPPSERWNLHGRSAHDEDELLTALRHRAHYVVVGPVFPTSSKPDVQPLGVDRLSRLVEVAGGIPVLAIGGITPSRVQEVMEAGAYGVAVRSGITMRSDPQDATRDFLEALEKAANTLGGSPEDRRES